MRCEACGVEMMIYREAEREDGAAAYVCRNPRCQRFDRRLEKRTDSREDPGGTDQRSGTKE